MQAGVSHQRLQTSGRAKSMQQGPVNLAGPVKALSESYFPEEFKGIYQRPAEARKLFAERGWSTVAVLQLRNPMHNSMPIWRGLRLRSATEFTSIRRWQTQARRHSGECPRKSNRRAGEQVFPQGARNPGWTSHGDALRGPARSPAARDFPPELRLFASDRRTRPCRRRRLLRTLRFPEDLQGNSLGVAELQALCMDWTFYCYECGPWPR